MSDITITAKCKDTAGTLILDLSVTNGYQLAPPASTMSRLWRRSVVEADDVEGDVQQQAVLAAVVWEQPLRVVGTSTASVEARLAALFAAVERCPWHFEVTIDGFVRTWVAGTTSTEIGLATNDLVHFKRPVTLRIPVQPRTVEELA